MDSDDEVKGWVVWYPTSKTNAEQFPDYPYFQEYEFRWYALKDLKYAEEIKALADLNGPREDRGRFSATFCMPKEWLEKKGE